MIFHRFLVRASMLLLLGVGLTKATGAEATTATMQLGATTLLKQADALRAEKSWRLAHEAYGKILATRDTDGETTMAASLRRLECLWHDNQPDDHREEVIKGLIGLVDERLPMDSHWWAEAAELLGDCEKEYRDYYEFTRHNALRDWVRAAQYWGILPDRETARPHYLTLNFKIAGEATRNAPGFVPITINPSNGAIHVNNDGDPNNWKLDERQGLDLELANWAMHNVLRVSVDPVERCHALCILGEQRLNKWDKDHPAWSDEGRRYLNEAFAIEPLNEWNRSAFNNLFEILYGTGQAEEALALYAAQRIRFKLDENPYDYKMQWLNKIRQPGATLAGDEACAPGSHIRFKVSYRLIRQARVRIERVTLDQLVAALNEKDGRLCLAGLKGETVRELAVTGIKYDGRHDERDTELFTDPLKPGIYMAVIDSPGAMPDEKMRLLFRVSALATAVQHEGATSHVFVSNAETGVPVAGARVRFFFRLCRYVKADIGRNLVAAKWLPVEGRTDRDGIAVVQYPDTPLPEGFEDGNEVFVIAEKGDQVASVGDIWNLPQRTTNVVDLGALLVDVSTDRPAYRPGETIHWKAILREAQDGERRLPVFKRVRVQVGTNYKNPIQSTLYEGEHELNEYGTIHGSFTTDRAAPLGELCLKISKASDKYEIATVDLCRLEEYKLPEFRVAVKPAASEPAAFGGPVAFEVQAEYYAGGPVPGAQVEVEIFRRRLRASPTAKQPYPWYYDKKKPGGWAEGWARPVDEFDYPIQRNRAVTDARGRARIKVDAPESKEMDEARKEGAWGFEYRAETRVTDASRREGAGVGLLHATRTGFTATLTPLASIGRRCEPLRFDLATRDANERPVAAQGQVTILRRAWNERRAGKDGNPEPDYDDTPLATLPAATDGDKACQLEYTPLGDGCYLLRYAARDAAGEPVETETAVFIADGRTRTLGYHSDGVTIVTDKDSYAPGETAQVLLAVRRPGAAIWFGIGAEGTTASLRVVRPRGNVTLLAIPVTPAFEPNVTLSALTLCDFGMFEAEQRLVVPPVRRFLNVTIHSPKDTFAPGERATLEVEARDRAGQPVQAELALGMADAAVWAVADETTGDIRKTFWGQTRDSDLNFCASPGDYRTENWRPRKDRPGEFGPERDPEKHFDHIGAGRFFENKWAPMPTCGMAGSSLGYENTGVQIRKNFPATALWLPTLVTGPDGRARAEVTFPDSLTAWRVTARAVDQATRVGQVRIEARTNRLLAVRPQGPRYFIQGDQATLSAVVVNNTTQTLPVEVSLETAGLSLTGENNEVAAAGHVQRDEATTAPVRAIAPSARVAVLAGGQRRVDWLVTAGAPGAARVKMTATSAALGDGAEQTFPIHEYGIEQFLMAGAKISGVEARSTGTLERRLTLTLPTKRRPGSERLTLWVEPALARSLADALDYLADYPYGCVEQTVSRFVPAVIARHTLERFKIPNERLEKELPGMIEDGLTRLANAQNNDGSWGWWPGQPADPLMTAYAMQALAQARASGVAVNKEMIDYAARYLVNYVLDRSGAEDKPAPGPDLFAFALYALAEAGGAEAGGKAADKAHDTIWEQRDRLGACSRALYALACQKTGRTDRAAVLARNLRTGLSQDPAAGTAHWGSDGARGWHEGPVEATALALRALLAIDPQSELIEPAAAWLTRNRKGCRWENTHDTALAVQALAEFTAARGEDQPDWTAEIVVNGRPVKTLRATPGEAFALDGRVEVPAGALHDGENTIIIRRIGRGALYATAGLIFFTHEEIIKPAGNEVSVERRFFLLRSTPTLSGHVRTLREPLAPGMALCSGDRVEVELTLTARNDYPYLMVEDRKAAGLEPADPRSGPTKGGRILDNERRNDSRELEDEEHSADGGLEAYREVRDDRTAFFIGRLPQGRRTLRYQLRAEVPGIFHGLPTTIQAMYVPELRGNGANNNIRIVNMKP